MLKNGSKTDINIVYDGIDKWNFETTKIAASQDHFVLFRLPILPNEQLKPFRSPDLWDGNHVRMPCSDQSKYVEIDENGIKVTKNRWNLIEQSLLIDFNSSYDLEKAIKNYNTRYESWNFASLHNFINNVLTLNERNTFLQDLLPKIVRFALRLPEIIQCPIPLLKKGMTRSISMSQEQAACILANSFLCTFPRRNTTKRDAEFANYPEINFNRLYGSDTYRVNQKLYCILNYFDRIFKSMPQGAITFSRRSLKFDQLPDWSNNAKTFADIRYCISSDKRIENADGMLQVDFANKYIGGGVLGNGLVQEEIRFLINPELIVSKLFTECLDHEESFVITGTEQFNAYYGYASTFKFGGNFKDETQFDNFRRRRCEIVAIDALSYRNNSEQFKEENLLRELNKAYAGFYNEQQSIPSPVSSGFWGAGAFQGDPIKAALIQFIACCETKRNLAFFTFGDVAFQDTIFELFEMLVERNVTVGKLYQILKQYNPSKYSKMDLATFVKEKTKVNVIAEPLKNQPKISEHFKLMFKSVDGNSSGSMSSRTISERTSQSKIEESKTDFKFSFTNHSLFENTSTSKVKEAHKNPIGRSLLDSLDDDFFNNK